MYKQNSFATVKSTNELFEVKIGKPKNTLVNLFFNFNISAYMEFVAVIKALPYLRVDNTVEYEDGTSGMSIEITKFKGLTQFIEDMPDILFLYVENLIRK